MHSAIHGSNFELWQVENDYIMYMEITKINHKNINSCFAMNHR